MTLRTAGKTLRTAGKTRRKAVRDLLRRPPGEVRSTADG